MIRLFYLRVLSIAVAVLAVPTLTDLPPGFSSRSLVSTLRSPARIVFNPHNNDLFVVEMTGRLLVWSAANSYTAAPISALDLRASAFLDTTGERGLLNVAFNPSDADTIFVS